MGRRLDSAQGAVVQRYNHRTMAVRTTSWLSLPSLLRTLVAHGQLAWRLLRDPGVPTLIKVLPLAAVLYLVSPIDGVPDFLPVLGQLDDLGVLLLALQSFLKLCPDHIVAFHRSAMAAGRPFAPASASGGTSRASHDIIDVEFSRDDHRR